jgi:hypothetical protein
MGQRQIAAVSDESALPSIAYMLLLCGERRNGPKPASRNAEKQPATQDKFPGMVAPPPASAPARVLDYILVSLFFRLEPLYPSASVGLSHINVALGIGENLVQIRARVAEKLGWLGVIFDSSANALQKTLISRPESPIGLYVVPTDEELMIARHTLSFLCKHSFSEKL